MGINIKDMLLPSVAAVVFDMALPERVVVDPQLVAGKPVIRSARLSVEFTLGLPAAGQPEDELLHDCAGISREDILACLSYAAR